MRRLNIPREKFFFEHFSSPKTAAFSSEDLGESRLEEMFKQIIERVEDLQERVEVFFCFN